MEEGGIPFPPNIITSTVRHTERERVKEREREREGGGGGGRERGRGRREREREQGDYRYLLQLRFHVNYLPTLLYKTS